MEGQGTNTQPLAGPDNNTSMYVCIWRDKARMLKYYYLMMVNKSIMFHVLVLQCLWGLLLFLLQIKGKDLPLPNPSTNRRDSEHRNITGGSRLKSNTTVLSFIATKFHLDEMSKWETGEGVISCFARLLRMYSICCPFRTCRV